MRASVISGFELMGGEGVIGGSIPTSDGEFNPTITTNWKVEGRLVVLRSQTLARSSTRFMRRAREVTERGEIYSVWCSDRPIHDAIRKARACGALRREEGITGTVADAYCFVEPSVDPGELAKNAAEELGLLFSNLVRRDGFKQIKMSRLKEMMGKELREIPRLSTHRPSNCEEL